MTLRLVCLILITIGQINTQYKMLLLVTECAMALLTFRDTDVH